MRCVEEGGLCSLEPGIGYTQIRVLILRERSFSLRALALLAETRARRNRVVATWVPVILAFVRGLEVVWLRRNAQKS